jgi:hypothetical protein
VNPKLDPSDPRPMIAIVAAAVAFALWRLVAGIEVDRILGLLPSLAPLAPGALTTAAALATHRIATTRRTLRSRRAVAVVPADEFDPEPEAVVRFASQIAASERRIGGWLDRRASSIRIRLAGDAEGRLAYLVEVPERATRALRTALETYDGVELRPVEEVLPGEDHEERGRVILRTELVLGRPGVEPLARLARNPDPLQPFAAAVAALRSDHESAAVCLDLMPASGFRAARLRRRLKREARRIHGDRRDWSALFSNDRRTPGPPDPAQRVERRESVRALDAKLREGGELFEAQILLRCEAGNRGRAEAAMSGLLAAFRPLADRNYLRASGVSILGLAFLGSDLPFRRRRFDLRFRTGLFRPARKAILTARELYGFMKPPTIHCGPRNVLRSGALLSPPPQLPTFSETRTDLIPLGRVADESGERIVGVPIADTVFSYLAGRTRYGKTEAAVAQFAHLVRAGHGGLFLDPHGDGIARLEPYLQGADEAGRVVRINVGPGSSPADLPAWNLFELGGGPAEPRTDAVVDAFASALEWRERSTRAINLTAQAAAALTTIGARLGDRDLAPTIFQIPTLLGDAEWRRAVLPLLPRASQRFWTDRFPLLAGEAITPVTNMVDRLRASAATTVLLGRSRSGYRAREAMDQGKVVLVTTGSGGVRERLIANLFLFDLLHTALGRADVLAAQRRPFWIFLDEVQTYDGAASDNLANLLEQSAKFGIKGVLLNQNPERLSPATLNALMTNRSHLLASALNSHAAALITKEWGRQPAPEALTRMQKYRFIAQVTFRDVLSPPFAIGGVRVEDALGEVGASGGDRPPGSRSDPGAAADVIEHLDALDDRILAALKNQRRRHPEGRAHSRSRGPARAKRTDAK